MNSLAPGRHGRNFKSIFSNSLTAGALAVKLFSSKCHRTLLMTSQHWVRKWLGAIRQQAITCANVDPDLCRHMVSLGHNELRGVLDSPCLLCITWEKKCWVLELQVWLNEFGNMKSSGARSHDLRIDSPMHYQCTRWAPCIFSELFTCSDMVTLLNNDDLHKTVTTPLLTHWSNHSLAISYRYGIRGCWSMCLMLTGTLCRAITWTRIVIYQFTGIQVHKQKSINDL